LGPHQVNQTQYPQVIRDPTWKRNTNAEVEAVIGEAYVAPVLDAR